MATQAIRLPEERAEQARQLAALHGITVSDLVGSMIAAEARRAGLGLGNIDIADLEDGTVHFDCGAGVHIWTRAQTAEVAQAIERVLDKNAGLFDLDARVEVVRVGLAVRLRNLDTGGERTFAASVARDLVARLRHHAA